MKTILLLTLKREYFDAIAIGEKRIEYRERKPYWQTRLEGKTFDLIRFRNGYLANAPEMEIEFRGVSKVRKWGSSWYAIQLGRVLKIKRWKQPPAPAAREAKPARKAKRTGQD